MNKGRVLKFVVYMIVVFVCTMQVNESVCADEVFDYGKTSGKSIKAGFATIFNEINEELIINDGESSALSDGEVLLDVNNKKSETIENDKEIILTGASSNDEDDLLIEDDVKIISDDSITDSCSELLFVDQTTNSEEKVNDSNSFNNSVLDSNSTFAGNDTTDEIFDISEVTESIRSYMSSGVNYNVNGALSYAKNAGSMACNQFVAGCLSAGGLDISAGGNVAGLRSQLINSGLFEEIIVPVSNYEGFGNGTRVKTYGNIKEGDVIIFMCKEQDSRPPHTALVTDIVDGYIKMTDRHAGRDNEFSRDVDYKCNCSSPHSVANKKIIICVYHFIGNGDDCKMKNGVDKVKEGEYVIVSALSLDDNGKIKKNRPYALDLDDTDVVVDRSLSDKTPVWEIEHIEKRFYNIYNRKRNKVISLEDRNCDDKTNIHICRWNEDNHESWWSFSEEWDGQYIIENKYSEMCATRSNGDSVKQREFYGRKDDAVDNQLWLLVRPDKPTIKTGSLPNGEVGKGYSATLEGDCDEWIAIEWSLAGSSGALPNGLSLSKDGVLSGTPTETGTFNLKIIAENEFGYTTENYTLVIEGGVSVTGITLNKTSLELSKGSVAILTPTVSPENATDKSFTCKSSDENVVTVSSSGKTVSVTPVNEGTATITVTSNSNKDKSASCKVTVKPSITQVTSVSLNKSSLELVAGSSEILMATVLPGTATDRSVTWKSSDEKVATVSSSGKVTAIKEGNATITVTSNSSNDKSASCKITVKPAPTGVIIKADEVNGAAGKEVSVPVRISNNTGLGSMALTITSDSDLTLKNIEKGSLLSFGTFNTDTETGFVQWYTSSDKAVTGDGVLFTLKFNVKAGAEKKSHPVNISFKDNLRENVTDEKSNVLDVTLLPGNVNTTIVKGDVTGDGVVAMGDVVKVARAVAGNSTLTDDEKEAADVTGDKVVAMGDVVKIARYVAGSVTEL